MVRKETSSVCGAAARLGLVAASVALSHSVHGQGDREAGVVAGAEVALKKELQWP